MTTKIKVNAYSKENLTLTFCKYKKPRPHFLFWVSLFSNSIWKNATPTFLTNKNISLQVNPYYFRKSCKTKSFQLGNSLIQRNQRQTIIINMHIDNMYRRISFNVRMIIKHLHHDQAIVLPYPQAAWILWLDEISHFAHV